MKQNLCVFLLCSLAVLGRCEDLQQVSAVAPEAGSETVAVPGGLTALASVSEMNGVPEGRGFLEEYCRAIAMHTSGALAGETPGYLDDVQAYTRTVAALQSMSEKGSLKLSLVDPVSRPRTLRVLALFGWAVSASAAGERVELGSRQQDAALQRIPSALGIDELAVASTLAAGRSIELEIPIGQAILIKAKDWASLAGELPAGGFPELFARHPRWAEVYAALAGMQPEAMEALVSGVGLRRLAEKHAQEVWRSGWSFSETGGRVAVPGGAPAEKAWTHLVEANPGQPEAFFRNLLEKDRGRLASYYSSISFGGEAQQRYFTRDAARLGRFYEWFRRARGPVWAKDQPDPVCEETLRSLPVDEAGRVRFPGGRAAWSITPSEDEDSALLRLPSMERLLGVVFVEAQRRAPFDEASVRLLTEHYDSWLPLFPYFARLPAVGRTELEALRNFEKAVSQRPLAARDAIMGEWHALVKLIVLGVQAGSVSPADAARDFRLVCERLAAPDHPAGALRTLREIVGDGASLDEAVASRLLRLKGDRRASFDRVRQLLHAPLLGDAPGPLEASTAPALAGVVYGVVLNPDDLLVTEDPLLLSKHRYVEDSRGASLFLPTSLQRACDSPGTCFHGGFMSFEQKAETLAPTGIRGHGAGGSGSSAALPRVELSDRPPLFHATARLVEVYATVTDSQGKYLDGLARSDFRQLDNGEPVKLESFEDSLTRVSVVLLLDLTGSMRNELPALRASALKLIGSLRPSDSVAVYGFNDTVSERQSFTSNKDEAMRAILHTRASGVTALHDALVRVAHLLHGRPGKKAIVVFTDGVDNASTLVMDRAVEQAKATGAPIYTIAYGAALGSAILTRQLADLSRATGGLSFAVEKPSEMGEVFTRIAHDVEHGYLLTFTPKAPPLHQWRTLRTEVARAVGHVRARQGYYLE